MKNYQLTPKEMADIWDAYSVSKSLEKLDDYTFSGYQTRIISQADKLSTALMTNIHDGAVLPIREKRGSNRSPTESASVVTPSTHAKKRQQHTLSSSGKQQQRRITMSPTNPRLLLETSPNNLYKDRTGSGTVVATYNPHNLMDVDYSVSNRQGRCKCAILTSKFLTNEQKPYRHLFTTIEERAQALDRMIRQNEELFMERYLFGTDQIAQLEAVGVPSQDKICCIGRICNESHQGRINSSSVLLEGSLATSGGQRIRIDMEHMRNVEKQSYSLFPGQIVAVEGMNTSGRKMIAHRICEGIAPEPVKSTIRELIQYHHGDDFQAGAPLQIMLASGPFTLSSNIEYEPLNDLLNLVIEKRPDVVILTGPFVDMQHKAVAAGQTVIPDGKDESGNDQHILVPFEVFFAETISAFLEDLYIQDESLPTQFVLVPSLEDATAQWVYPQPPFEDNTRESSQHKIDGGHNLEIGSLGLYRIETETSELRPRRVHCVSNPCTLQINELIVGVTSTDVLFHVSAEETNANLESGSRMARIAQHMVMQRSYYPLFPAFHSVDVDLKRADRFRMPCSPDLLLLPSKLAPFCKPIVDQGTLVVNHGHLTRDAAGGTYAIIEVHPMERGMLENAGGDDVELRHNVQDRTRVEIKKI
jgi:DNA polymerase alpha subunit B